MIAAASAKTAPVSRLAIFRARAEARSLLWQAGEFDLHEAVDVLQQAAVDTGLVAEIGQHVVQQIMAKAFDVEIGVDAAELTEPADDEYEGLSLTFAAACREADVRARQQRAAQHSERPAPHAATATLQTAEYLVREGNAEQFRAWLAKQPARSRAAVKQHLGRRKGR
jgi:hypothetical protein